MAQKGFVYEKNVATFLKRKNLVESSYNPAGASSDRPDLEIKYGSTRTPLGEGIFGVELKTDLASAGSLVFHYNRKTKTFEWGSVLAKDPKTGEIGPAKEKVFLKGIGTKKRAMAKVKQNWKQVPYNQTNRDKRWASAYGHVPLFERYTWDKENFPDIIQTIESDSIEKYYNLKDTHYLNVGTKGFYLLGAKDPMELNVDLAKRNKPLVPRWKDSNTTSMRLRVQPKDSTNAMKRQGTKNPLGGQGYQFTFELQFQGVKSSPYNITPITGGSVNINASRAVLPFGKVP